MKGRTANILVLVAVWALVFALGVYWTFRKQPAELDEWRQAARVVQLKQDEAGLLRLQTASSEQTAREVLSRWNARYKVMPDTLKAHEVVAYFNTLTQEGFKNVDVQVEGITPRPDYNAINLKVSGRGLYRNLYDFVWALENNRLFYKITSLNLDQLDLITKFRDGNGVERERLDVLVSFTMEVDALYGGTLGASQNGATAVLPTDGTDPMARVQPNAPPGVPASVLPTRRPPRNPFYPLILSQIPPNTYGLMDVEQATLISIADGRAIFSDGDGYRTLGVGSEVYLGEISSVDPRAGTVRARLNRGGIVDEVTRKISGDAYGQAPGGAAPAGDAYRPVNPDGSAAASESDRPLNAPPRSVNPLTGN